MLAEKGYPLRENVQNLLLKAERSFAAAERLLEDGDADFATSRAYYGYFYGAESLLLSKGFRFSRHSQVIAQYGFHFARTNQLAPRFHRLFDRAFTLRQLADYSADPAVMEPQTVRDLIEGGREFLVAAKEYLDI